MSHKTICDYCETPIGPRPLVKLKIKITRRYISLYGPDYGDEKDFCKYTCAVAYLNRERDKL